MRDLPIQPLTAKGFAAFGDVIEDESDVGDGGSIVAHGAEATDPRKLGTYHRSSPRTGENMDTISLVIDSGVAHLMLSRPDAANTINRQMSRELREAAVALQLDRTVRAVLLS